MSPGVKNMRIKRVQNTEGVSEVIANVIVVGMVVILFSLIFYYVATIPVPKETERLNFDLTLESSNEFQAGSMVYLNITPTGGRALSPVETVISVKVDNGGGVLLSLGDGGVTGVWALGQTWRLVTKNDATSALRAIVTPSSIAYVTVIDIRTSSVLWGGQVFPRINRLGPVIIGGTDPMPVSPNSSFILWARVVEVEGQGIGNVTFVSPELGYTSHTPMTYNLAKDRWEYPPGVVLPPGKYSFTVYAWDLQGRMSSKVIYFVVGKPTFRGPDLEVKSEYITFSDDAPIHGTVITIYAVIFNIGGETIGANVTFYLDDYNSTQGIIGYYNITTIAAGEGTSTQITWRATPGGPHTIWVRAGGYPDPGADVNPSNNIDSRGISVMPRILLVDDDQETDSSPYTSVKFMKASLEATDFSYDLFVCGSGTGPDYDSGNTQLRDYDVVIWMTGRTTSNTLTWDQPVTGEDDVGHLTQFLLHGGRLWLIGEGIMNEAAGQQRLKTFINTYIQATTTLLDAGLPGALISTDSAGTPTPIWKYHVITFPISSLWSDGADRVSPSNPGNAVLVDASNRASVFAVNYSARNGIYEYRTVFFPFAFPFISDPGDQAQVTYFMMLWLSGMDKRMGRDLAVSSLTITPSRPRFMQNVLINYTIRNNGDTGETGFKTLITDTYNGVETVLVDQVFSGVIPAFGGESDRSYTWVPDKLGTHRIRVIVDWDNMIPETNEENNEISSFLASGDIFVGYNILIVDDDGKDSSTPGTSNYNSTLSIVEDIEYMNDHHTTGLVASYRMERRYLPSTMVLDSSGYRLHGTLYNGALLSSTAGRWGGTGLLLDGVNDYLRVEDSPQLDPGTGVTLEAWVKTTDTAGRIIDKWSIAGTSWTRSYLLSLGDASAGKVRFAVALSAGGSALVDSKNAINDGGWHHVVATDNGYTLSIYIDGYLDNTFVQGSHSINDGTHPLIIGWSGSNSEGGYLAGSIDNVRIYSRALSPAEVSRQYTYSEERDPFEYDYWRVPAGSFSGPNVNVMNRYNAVIWDAGVSSQVFTKGDRENITLFLQRTNPVSSFYLIAQNISQDIQNTPASDRPAYITFMCTSFGVDMNAQAQVTRTTYYGKFNDTISHGMMLSASSSSGSGSGAYLPRRAPACSTPGDSTEGILHADPSDSYWVTTSTSYYGFRHSSSTFGYKGVLLMVDPSYLNPGPNMVTPRGEFTYMVVHWFGAPDPRANPRITAPDIYVGQGYGTPLSSSILELSRGYLLKVRIRNTGMTQVSGLSLRFMDGNVVIGTATTSIDPARYSGNDLVDGVTVVETLWAPMFAGVENISVILDPGVTSQERTRVDDIAYQSTRVYFFYDDLESGAGKWKHETVLTRINGEGPLDILAVGTEARTDIPSTWDMTRSSGYELVTNAYHSQNSSYYLKETPPYPLDVMIILDNGPPMHQPDAIAYMKSAAKLFIGMMRSMDRVGLISYRHVKDGACGKDTGTQARYACVLMPLTYTTTSGKNALNSSVDSITGENGVQTPIIDSIWLAGMELILNNSLAGSRTLVIISLTASSSQNDDRNPGPPSWPPPGACCGQNGDQYNWAGYSSNSGIRRMPLLVYAINSGTAQSPLLQGVTGTADGGAYYATNGDMSRLPAIFYEIALILLGGVQTLTPGENHADLTIDDPGIGVTGLRFRHKWLVTPEISLAGYSKARMTFWQRYKMIPGQNGGLVQVGVRPDDCPDGQGQCPSGVYGRYNDGIHWEYIMPITPYNSNLNISQVTDESNATYQDPNYLKDCDGKEMLYAWSGTSTHGTFGWEFVDVDLGRYVGHSIRVNLSMFQFSAGTGNGWWIDDLVITGTRAEGSPVSPVKDQWVYICGTFAGRTTCVWRNQDTGNTNLLKGGLDNYLLSSPIDLTKAKTAYLDFDVMYNVNSKAGLPPDSLRVEISDDGGLVWKPVNLGIRIDPGVSGGGGTPAWISSTSLTRYERNISGWAGKVVTIRFRVVTTTESGYAHRDASSTCTTSTAWCGGIWLDNIRISGDSVKKGLSPASGEGINSNDARDTGMMHDLTLNPGIPAFISNMPAAQGIDVSGRMTIALSTVRPRPDQKV